MMVTRRGERLIIRGGLVDGIPGIPTMNGARASQLAKEGWRFSGHTHTPGYQAVGSAGDKFILGKFGQRRNGVWGAEWGSKVGQFFSTFVDEIDFLRGLYR